MIGPYLMTTATSPEEADRHSDVAVLPVGSFEQHGPHLPLITDTVIACAIAEALATSYDLSLLAPVTFSCSHEHAAFPGTVSISPSTLAAIVGVTIRFEAVEGSDMEGLPAVGNLRNASAVFFHEGGRWVATGRTVFNLSPDEVIAHFGRQYERVEAG